MTAINREAWITLALTPGIGPQRFQSLIGAFGSPDGAQAAPFALLCTVPGISRACATAVRDAARLSTGAQALEALERLGAVAIIPPDPLYPAQLREIPDPPMVLFGWGGTTSPERLERLERLSAPSAAIVGTRHPTDYGAEVTRRAAIGCVEAGIAVVSGMARGCDAIAHSAALDAGGDTIGVLGNGFGIIYPAANRALYERMVAEGLLLSEFPPGERPHAGSFPRRNRLISGLARATLVVEAGETSGALITASAALEQGREVLAVPGMITSGQSAGTNRLIRDGATPFLGGADLIGLYPEVAGRGSRVENGGGSGDRDPRLTTLDSGLPATTDPLLRHVPHDGALLDTIVDGSGWPVAKVLDRLMEFELEGRVEQRPGRVFRRVS
jgi:DNA processing protein